MLAAACVGIYRMINQKEGSIVFIAFDVILMINLILGVICMKMAIKSTKMAFPNEKFVKLHLINFTVWALAFIYCMLMAIYTIYRPKGWSDKTYYKFRFFLNIMKCVSKTLQLYINCFILFLIYSYAIESKYK